MFLDIAIGILLSIWVNSFFQVNLSMSLIIAGIIFALLPDIDFFIEFTKYGSVGGKVIREHREIMHFPLSYIPSVFLIYILFGSMWAVFFGLAILAHFLHDSVGIGWGIKWLWPFSNRAFKLFSDKRGKLSSHLLVSWDHKELTEVVTKYGDPDWIRNIYLRLHPISVIEFLSFLFALAVLFARLGRIE